MAIISSRRRYFLTWNAKFNSSRCVPQCTDGVLDNSDIANHFASNFEEAYKPDSTTRYNKLKDQ